MRNEATGITRGATPLWMWVALLGLTLLTTASFALHFKLYASGVAQLPITPEPHWGWWLRYEWYLPAAIASLAILVFAPAALALRRWRPFALALLASAAFAQTAFLGLEHYWKQQERAGEFERPLPWMLETHFRRSVHHMYTQSFRTRVARSGIQGPRDAEFAPGFRVRPSGPPRND